jgi:7,8-dihydropterin-6-yl-methyl-4-(beta-D-ribofuranosyl)aminobenzene 5'-phosphate synthase
MTTVRRLSVTAVIEVTVDMLLTDAPGVKRFGLLDHFRPPHGIPIASENGFCCWIEAETAEGTTRVLYDTGLTGDIALRNFEALGFDVGVLDALIVSHAHPDHIGGTLKVLGARTSPLTTAVNFDAFRPKWIVDDAGGRVMCINEGFVRERLEAAGARLVDTGEPTEVVPGVTATGRIPAREAYEPPVPPRPGRAGIFVDYDGEMRIDDAALDEQGIAIDVGGRLVVLSACGHSGMINTVRAAQDITGRGDVRAVIGGFHFGFPGVPAGNVAPTLDALDELELEVLAPMHCTGLPAQARMLDRFPDRYVQFVGGTTITVGD